MSYNFALKKKHSHIIGSTAAACRAMRHESITKQANRQQTDMYGIIYAVK